MKCGLFIVLLLLPGAAMAQTVTPNFTQGSMTSTTTTTQTINETINIKTYGGDYTSISGKNVTPSGSIGAAATTYTVTDQTLPFQLETVSTPAGIVETQDVTRTIETESVTNSLSVFSQ